MLLREHQEEFEAWASANPLSRALKDNPSFLRQQPPWHQRSSSSVGVYYGAGKLFYDVYRPRGQAGGGGDAAAVEGAAFMLATAQGPAGFAHGGAVAHVLEDVCSLACGAACSTLSLEVRLRGKVPLLETLGVGARVTAVTPSPAEGEGVTPARQYTVKSWISAGAATLAEATAVMLESALGQAVLPATSARLSRHADACTIHPQPGTAWGRWTEHDGTVRSLKSAAERALYQPSGDGFRTARIVEPARAHAFIEGKIQLVMFARETEG
jgi:hypothetical protein